MTNWGFDDDTNGDQGNGNTQPGGLRQFAEAQQQENKALKSQLEAIQNTLRMQQLKGVFEEAGAPDALSKYDGEADAAKAKAWIEEQRKLFGVQAQQSPATNEQQPVIPAAPEPTLPPMLQQQFEQFSQAGQQGTPMGSFEQASANVGGAKDLQELINAMKIAQR